MKPIIIVNLKTYKNGKDAVKLAKEIEKVSKQIILGAQPTEIQELTKKTKLKIFSQHTDPYEPGRYTGFILPKAIKAAGAKGALLNHSEHKLDFKTLKKTIELCKKTKLQTAVFANSLSEAKKIEKLEPTFLIYEPPELVAGKISVSTAKPKAISNIAQKLKMPFLVGAGIKTSEDIKKSLELGAIGIAIASAITKAKHPKKVLKELLN